MKGQKGFTTIPLIIIIILAVLAIGGYWFWQESSQTSQVPSDWKTYRNEKYGFEVKYPKELIVDAERPYLTNLQGEESVNFGLSRVSNELPVNPVEISFTILEEDKDLDALMKNKISFDKILEHNKNQYKVLGEKLINNEVAYRFESFADTPGGSIKTGEHLVLKHNNLIFIMQFNLYPDNYLAQKDQILSTFRFIK